MIVPADGEAEVAYTVRYRGSRRALIGYQARKGPRNRRGGFSRPLSVGNGCINGDDVL